MQNYYSNNDVQNGIILFYNKIAARLMNGINYILLIKHELNICFIYFHSTLIKSCTKVYFDFPKKYFKNKFS
jgi:hypothetical protein